MGSLTGDTTEIRDVGRYNSPDYNNANRPFDVDVRIEINFQTRVQRRAVDRLLEERHIPFHTSRAKFDVLGHMQRPLGLFGLFEDLLKGSLAYVDVSVDGRVKTILDIILGAFERTSHSGFVFTDVLPCAVNIILNFFLCALETGGNGGFTVLDILLHIRLSFFIAIFNALLYGYAKSQKGKNKKR